MIRVALPFHLCTLAGAHRDILLDVAGGGDVTLAGALDALEARYPMLRGTIRDHSTGRRRDFLRFFACNRDLSNLSMDTPLPPEVATGTEPLLIVGAIAGG